MDIHNGRSLEHHRGSSTQSGNEEKLANALGWFSIGLGLAEVAAPAKMAKLIGVSDDGRTHAVLRTYGLREIAAGVGILSNNRPAGWVWGRVAGDMLDLASLASALRSDNSQRTRVATATAAVIGITALDLLCSQKLSRDAGSSAAGTGYVHVKKAVIINRSPEEVYQFWHNFENLPRFMKYLESVEILGDKRSHWKAIAPGGKTVEWDAEILDDRPNTAIAWRSLEGSDIPNSGSVRFERAPGDRGTLVRVELKYTPPGGAISAQIAKLFGADPGQHVEHDLRRLKQIMETGEVVESDASIHPGMHAAKPASAHA
jgi:uncharacterized membrane protein